MPLGVVIDDAAIRSAVLHGSGPDALDALRNAAAVDALLRLDLLAGRAKAFGAPTAVVEQTAAIARWLCALDGASARQLLEEPALRVLLADVDDAVAHGGARVPATAKLLPYALLGSLGAIDGTRRWVATIPESGRISPIGLSFRIVAADAPVEVVVRTTANTATLSADNRSCTVRWTDSASPFSGSGFGVVSRTRCLDLIEMVDVEAYPELDRSDLTDGTQLRSWSEALDARLLEAFQLLVSVWPEALEDVLVWCRALVALAAPDGYIYSSSSPHAPLVTQLTFHAETRPALLAETLVHECAHVKLDTLWGLDPLLDDDGVARYHHPWRPDARPLRGVLLGAHAFLNVAVLYGRAAAVDGATMLQREHETRMDEVRSALATLSAHARFTDTGRRVFAELCDVADSWA